MYVGVTKTYLHWKFYKLFYLNFKYSKKTLQLIMFLKKKLLPELKKKSI